MNRLLQKYLKNCAVSFLNRSKPEIIAITGSVGKTSAKDAIFEVLKVKFKDRIRKSEGNLNNETGVPLAILGFNKAPSFGASFLGWLPIVFLAPFRSLLSKKVEILVLELAADKPGDIEYLTSFVKPKVAVLTAIGPAHLEAFGTMEKIAEEKTALLKSLTSDGCAILNLDNDEVRKISDDVTYKKVSYTIKNNADLKAMNIKTEIDNFKPKTSFIVGDLNLTMPNLGNYANILAALAGIACGRIYKLSDKEIIEGLSNYRSGKHRMNVLRGKNGAIIIDDCYNANPLAMEAALNVLREIPCNGKKIAVLGDMLEIGKISEEAHKLIGEYAKNIADEVIAVGKLAKGYQGSAYFENSDEASDYLLKKIKPNDIILIKASRGAELEKIVNNLKA